MVNNWESTVKSPDLGVGDGVWKSSKAVVISKISGGSSETVDSPDVGVSKRKRLPQAPAEERICGKLARVDIPSRWAEFFICQRCGNKVDEEMLLELQAIKCSVCRFIVCIPQLRPSYTDEFGRKWINHFVNVYPVGYVEEIGMLKKRCRTRSCFLSFPYGEDDLMDFEVTIIPEKGLYKGARVVFYFDVPRSYPDESPVVRCKTKIFHPLIDLKGNVGICFLGHRWSRMEYSLSTVVTTLELILTVKRKKMIWGPTVALNRKANAMWNASRKLFFRKARQALSGGFVKKTYFPRCLIDK